MSVRPRILIVEDEMLIALMIKDIIEGLGFSVVGPAVRVDKALLLAEEELAGAVLDVNIAGRPVYPVVVRLEERGVPLLFITGYGNAGADLRHRNHPVLAKPFDAASLRQALLDLVPSFRSS